MLSKCANPNCSAIFRYLHEGTVFRLERSDPRQSIPDAQARSVEYFWLCGPCAESMKLVYEHGGIIVQPRRLQLPVSSVELKDVKVRKQSA